MVKALVTSNSIRRSLLAGEQVTAIGNLPDRLTAPSKLKIADGRAVLLFTRDEGPRSGVRRTSQAQRAARSANQTRACIDSCTPRTLCARSNRLLAGFKVGKIRCSLEPRSFSTRFQSGSAGIGVRIDVSSHPSVDLSGG